jgi:hypothetical protein
MTATSRGHAPAWTYLFRSGTGFEAGGAGEVELLDGAPRLGDRRVRVHSRPAPADLSGLDRYHGLVLFGPRRVRSRDLHSAGFVFVRRYGMFPSIAQPRWIIPLDPSFVALAALRALATPYRLRGRMLAAGAALLVRAGVPLGAREVLVASRERPPLEVELARLVDGSAGPIALASGGWGLRHTPTLVALSTAGTPLAFAKLAGSERSRMLIEREAHLLEAIAARSALRGLAPTLIHAGPLDGVYANVQTPLRGAPAPTRLGAAHDRFLTKLEGEPREAAGSAMLASVRERLPLAGADAGWLGRIANTARQALAGVPLPRTLVHGDFAPFNLRLDAGSLAGFDWENGTLDGLPLIDALHHELQVGFLLKDWDVGRAARSLDRFVVERSRAGLSGAQVRALQAVYLLDMYLRRLEGGHGPSSPLTSRYTALLHHVSVAEAA